MNQNNPDIVSLPSSINTSQGVCENEELNRSSLKIEPMVLDDFDAEHQRKHLHHYISASNSDNSISNCDMECDPAGQTDNIPIAYRQNGQFLNNYHNPLSTTAGKATTGCSPNGTSSHSQSADLFAAVLRENDNLLVKPSSGLIISTDHIIPLQNRPDQHQSTTYEIENSGNIVMDNTSSRDAYNTRDDEHYNFIASTSSRRTVGPISSHRTTVAAKETMLRKDLIHHPRTQEIEVENSDNNDKSSFPKSKDLNTADKGAQCGSAFSWRCQLCFKILQDAITLPCLDSFCLNCINSKVSIDNDSLQKCPICTARFDATVLTNPLQYPYVRFTRKAVKLHRIENREEDDKICEACESVIATPAVYFCMDCNSKYCQPCLRGHDLSIKRIYGPNGHEVITLGTPSSSRMGSTETDCEQNCQTHSRKFKWACYTCEKLCCDECCNEACVDHKVLPSDNLRSELSSINKSWKKYQDIIDETHEKLNSLKSVSENIRQQIFNSAEEFKAKIEKIKCELLDMHDRIIAKLNSETYATKRSADSGKNSQLFRFVEAVLRYGSLKDIMAFTNTLRIRDADIDIKCKLLAKNSALITTLLNPRLRSLSIEKQFGNLSEAFAEQKFYSRDQTKEGQNPRADVHVVSQIQSGIQLRASAEGASIRTPTPSTYTARSPRESPKSGSCCSDLLTAEEMSCLAHFTQNLPEYLASEVTSQSPSYYQIQADALKLRDRVNSSSSSFHQKGYEPLSLDSEHSLSDSASSASLCSQGDVSDRNTTSEPVGNNTVFKKTANIWELFPRLREKLDAQLLKMPPEKREWFSRNQDAVIRKLEQQHQTLINQRLQQQQQQQQTSSVCTGSFTLTLNSNDDTQIINLRKSSKFSAVTVTDKKIFALLEDQPIVNVYDLYKLTTLRPINIPDMKVPQYLAGCAYNRVLYISDSGSDCIHRVDLTNNSVTRWKMRENRMPYGLSVTEEHTVLVSVLTIDSRRETSLVEYTIDGQVLREILFQESFLDAYAVKLSSDQFIVSQTSYLHRVCVVNTEGQILKSYGRERGGGEGQLNDPCSLAVDYSRKRIFVADCWNNRVAVLDTDLTYLGEVHTTPDLKHPYYLCIDSSTDRLFVDELGGRLFNVSLSQITNYIKIS